MWERHWGMSRDPFLEDRSAYVPLPSHEEARSRLVYAIESSHRLAFFQAEAGLGKSMVLDRVLDQARRGGRRIATAADPIDAVGLWNDLADRLGVIRAGSSGDRAVGWRRLERGVRVQGLEGRGVVLAVDGADALWNEGGSTRADLLRLAHLNENGGSTTVVLVVRDASDDDLGPEPAPDWTLSIGLERLTRSEAERYLTEKLAASGRIDPLFTPGAVVRLHSLSSGVPRGLDRLASLSLSAAASRGAGTVSSEIVDDAAGACRVPWR